MICLAETLQLGGNIELTGFSEVDPATLVVLKKIVGNHAKRFSTVAKDFEKLHITLKNVHKQEDSQKYELHAKLDAGGKSYVAEITDLNLFFVLDKVLKKIENEISK
ncbi:MAG: hypothetical protein V1837_03615 [Candidatus Woesearchaeota archaeon]